MSERAFTAIVRRLRPDAGPSRSGSRRSRSARAHRARIALNVLLVPAGCRRASFPQQDTGRLNGAIRADQDSSFPATNTILLTMLDIVKGDPAVDQRGSASPAAGGTTNTGRLFVSLKAARGAWRRRRREIIGRLAAEAGPRPPARPSSFRPRRTSVSAAGRATRSISFALQGDKPRRGSRRSRRGCWPKMQHIPLIADVNSDAQNQGLQSYVQYKPRRGPRATASRRS